MNDEHECQFPEEQEPSGRLILTPCLECGLSAMDAIKELQNRLSTLEKEKKESVPLRPWSIFLYDEDAIRCKELALNTLPKGEKLSIERVRVIL